MTEKEIQQLIDRYNQGLASPREVAQIESWYLQHAKDNPFIDYPDDLVNRMDRGLVPIMATAQLKRQPRRVLPYLPMRYAAAVAILALVLGGWFYFLKKESYHEPALTAESILPGGNRATLTLANGQTVDLSVAHTGIVVGEEITYLDGSTVLGEDDFLTPSQVLTLSTPKGGTYQLTLPDGSQVWLNAASTLKYPFRFSGNERIVEVVGEAYFSVKKDASRPFKVLSEGQEITVLGTEFNISVYPDDPEVKTTLIEGSVKVARSDIDGRQRKMDNSYVVLKPGKQAVFSTRYSGDVQSPIEIRNVNTYQYSAWKEGYFYFEGTPLVEVLRQVSRWYDVEVQFRNEEVPGENRFGGQIKRDVTLQGLIEILQVSNINVTLEGRVLKVN